jgi:hypothetical protein
MSVDRITWFKSETVVNTWETPNSHRGYTGSILYDGTKYTLTITGTGAPAASDHETLRNAKNEFRKFLFIKSVN